MLKYAYIYFNNQFSYKPVSLKLSSLLKYGLVNVQVNHIVENVNQILRL